MSHRLVYPSHESQKSIETLKGAFLRNVFSALTCMAAVERTVKDIVLNQETGERAVIFHLFYAT